MNAVLGKFGRNFLVASFVPALAFASLSLFIFSPIIPQSVIQQLEKSLAPLNEPGLLLLMLTIVIGFSLHSLNTSIYKVLEGYLILQKIPRISNFQKRKIRGRIEKIRLLEKLHEVMLESDEYAEELVVVEDHLYRLSATFQRNHPLDQNSFMPTRFGNAFRALEIYPRLRYNIDSVLVFPRLLHVIPDSFLQKLDESNNRLTFLVNCSLLSLGTAILSGLATLYQIALIRYSRLDIRPIYFIDVLDDHTIYQQNAYLYLVGVIIMMVFAAIFYRASIPIVVQYGELVKAGFDLFRRDLIEELGLEKPSNFSDEKLLWWNLSMFFGHGLLHDDPIRVPFSYDQKQNYPPLDIDDVDIEWEDGDEI